MDVSKKKILFQNIRYLPTLIFQSIQLGQIHLFTRQPIQQDFFYHKRVLTLWSVMTVKSSGQILYLKWP